MSLNREASLSVYRSRVVIKADAAERVFDTLRKLNWAVIDAGIDARHEAFRKRGEHGYPDDAFESNPRRNNTRIVNTIDFTVSRSLTTILGDLRFDSLLPDPKGDGYEAAARETLEETLKDRGTSCRISVRDRLVRARLR